MGEDHECPYSSLPGEPEKSEDEQASTLRTWCRLVCTLLCTVIASSFCSGFPVWTALFASHGIFSHVCPHGIGTESLCSMQSFIIGNFFAIEMQLAAVNNLAAGILCDSFGGRTSGTMGNAMVLIGFLILQCCLSGASLGQDSRTSMLLPFGIVIADIGHWCSIQGVTAFVHHFSGRPTTIFALMGVASNVASFVPLLFELIISELGFSFVQCIWFACFAIAGSVLCYHLCCPGMQEYLKQAEQVLGRKLEPRKTHIAKLLGDINSLLLLNWKDHMAFVVLVPLSYCWVVIYGSVVVSYGTQIFHDPAAGAALARTVVTCQSVTGIVVFPIVFILAEVLGLRFMMLSLVLANSIGGYFILRDDWFSQTITACVSSYVPLVGVSVQCQRAMAYAPPTKLLTFQGSIGLYEAIVSLIFVVVCQTWMESLPAATRYQSAFVVLNTLGIVSSVVLCIVCCARRLPSSPTLLPEEIEDLCRCFGCKDFQDLAYVFHIENEINAEGLQGLLVATDSSVHDQLILSTDKSRLANMMNQVPVQMLAKGMRLGLAWQDGLMDQSQDVFGVNVSAAGAARLLSRVVDASKFGKGGAKSVALLQKELASGRSQLVVRDGKVHRVVDTVALRICYANTDSKLILVHVAEKLANGRERQYYQLPGTKKGPGDTLEMCVDKIRDKMGFANIDMNFFHSSPDVYQTKLESSSYPGVFTVYNKTVITGHVTDVDTVVLQSVGLPLGQPFHTECLPLGQPFHTESKLANFFEWMGEKQADLKIAEERLPDTSSAEQNPTSPCSGAGRLRSCTEILWSLQVREVTKALVAILVKKDKNALEYWLLSEPTNNIRDAIKDLNDWPTFTNNVFGKLIELLPMQDLIVVLQKREELQAAVVDLLVLDLDRLQKTLRAQGNIPACKNGHPLWPYFVEAEWECSTCGHVFQANRRSYFRCTWCNVNMCPTCSEDELRQSWRVASV